MRAIVVSAVVLLLGMLQAGCGMEALAAPTTHTIVIEGMKFVPETLRVKRGDVVVWANRDFFPHTATAQNRSFDSHAIATNKTWKYVAQKDGTFAYVCTLHPTMKGTLIVE